MRILKKGWVTRRTGETAMNRESSRSHAMFSIDVRTEELINTIVNKKSATLNMVDLAGSERQSQAPTVGNRFKEAVNINKSLSVLSRVIRMLSSANQVASYRESKLTLFLRDSLGGNSRTAVIVNLHPDKEYYYETLSTLRFAAACRKIENRVHANEDHIGDTAMAYKSEISRLRAELDSKEEKIRSEMAAKVRAEEELERFKENAISREKQLSEALLQRDLFAAQLTRKPSGDGDVKSQDDIVREALQMSKRIDSVKTFEELTRVQLERDSLRTRTLRRSSECADSFRAQELTMDAKHLLS
ncbi:kinesin motor domain protein [Cooperia oncophora]